MAGAKTHFTFRIPYPAFWILVAVLAAIPLALAPGLHFFDVTPKWMALILGTALVWIALAAENRFPNRGGAGAGFFWLMAGLAAAGALATVFSEDRVISLAGSEWRRMGLPAWLACLALAAAVPMAVGEDRLRRRRVVLAIVLAAVAASLYGVAQYLGYDPWIPPALYHIGEGEWQIVRPPATLGHVSYFAAFILPAVFAAAGLALSAANVPTRLAWGAAAALLALALLISGSRGAWLGAAAGTAVLLLRLRRRRAVLMSLLVFSAIAAAFALSPAGQPLRSRLRWFVEDPAGGARLPLWRDSLRLGAAHPLLGTGPDTFQLSFLRFESLNLAQNAPDRSAESPHNVFLDYLTTAGLPAMLMFAGLMGMALWNYGAAPDARFAADAPLDAGLLAALVAGLAAEQFIADTIPTRVVLLTIAALSVTVPVGPARPAARYAVAAAAAASLALGLLFAGRLARADRAMWEARRAIAARNLPLAAQAAGIAQRAFPWTGTYAFVYSQELGRLFSVAPPGPQSALVAAVAEEAARAALPHSSRPQMLYVQLASLYVMQGRKQEAQEALEAAVRFAPAWYRPRWLLAVLLSDAGRHRQAAEQAAAALERGARRHREIAASCAAIQRQGR